MLSDVLQWMLEGGSLAFLAWGGYLCISERERRSRSDRRRAPRGGRRRHDALAAGQASHPRGAVIVRDEPTARERAARMVA
jgi:hypothetical protein